MEISESLEERIEITADLNSKKAPRYLKLARKMKSSTKFPVKVFLYTENFSDLEKYDRKQLSKCLYTGYSEETKIYLTFAQGFSEYLPELPNLLSSDSQLSSVSDMGCLFGEETEEESENPLRAVLKERILRHYSKKYFLTLFLELLHSMEKSKVSRSEELVDLFLEIDPSVISEDKTLYSKIYFLCFDRILKNYFSKVSKEENNALLKKLVSKKSEIDSDCLDHLTKDDADPELLLKYFLRRDLFERFSEIFSDANEFSPNFFEEYELCANKEKREFLKLMETRVTKKGDLFRIASIKLKHELDEDFFSQEEKELLFSNACSNACSNCYYEDLVKIKYLRPYTFEEVEKIVLKGRHYLDIPEEQLLFLRKVRRE